MFFDLWARNGIDLIDARRDAARMSWAYRDKNTDDKGKVISLSSWLNEKAEAARENSRVAVAA